MTRGALLRGLGAGALMLGAALATSPAAVAAPAGGFTTECQTSTFPKFNWSPTVDAKATGDGATTSLTLQLSDLPGVVPVSLTNLDMVGTLNVEVNGVAQTLTGTKKINITSGQPFGIPAVTASFASTATELDVVVKKISYNISAYAMDTVCPAGAPTASYALDKIQVQTGTVPSPTPTPTPTPSPTPTPTPSPTPSPTKGPKDEGGKAAKGTIAFDCMLSAPFNSAFRYESKTSVSGARKTESAQDVTLAGTFSKLPGIAPVPITGGKMTVTVKGKVGGMPVTLSGKSTVNAASKEAVPVPTLTGSMKTKEVEAKVQIETFRFEFEEMAGLAISADCEASKGATMGMMTIGVGSIDDVMDNDGSGGSGAGGASSGGTTTLPQTGGGDAMPVIGLWALALGVIGAGALVWLPKQRRSTV